MEIIEKRIYVSNSKATYDGESFIIFTNGSTVKFNNVDSAPFAGLSEFRADRDKIAGRLSKCREEKRVLAAQVDEAKKIIDNMRGAGSVLHDVCVALGCKREDAILKAREVAERAMLENARAERLAQIMCRMAEKLGCHFGAVENIVSNLKENHEAAKSELQRLKTQFSPPQPVTFFGPAMPAKYWTIYGMSLDEVRGLKAERDGLKRALNELEKTLAASIQNALGNAAKLDAVTSALKG